MIINSHNRITIALIFSLIGGLVCGYQIFGESRDYRNYFEFFDVVRSSLNFFDIHYRFEPGFTSVAYILIKFGLNNFQTYAFIVFFIIFIKYIALKSSSNCWTVFLVFTLYYSSRYFILFEMTVLRGACALSLAFYVFYTKTSVNFKYKEFCILLLAVTFHYSAIVFLPIYLIKPNGRLKLLIILVATFLTIIFLKSLILNFLSDSLGGFSDYEGQNRATLLPIPMVFDLLLFVFAVTMLKSSDLAMRYATLGLGFSIVFHFALIEYAVFSNRFRELLSVFILIYVIKSFLCSNVRVRFMSGVYFIITSIIYIYGYLIYDPLLS